MPRVPGRRRPSGGYDGNGCLPLLAIFAIMWIGLLILTHWDTIW